MIPESGRSTPDGEPDAGPVATGEARVEEADHHESHAHRREGQREAQPCEAEHVLEDERCAGDVREEDRGREEDHDGVAEERGFPQETP